MSLMEPAISRPPLKEKAMTSATSAIFSHDTMPTRHRLLQVSIDFDPHATTLRLDRHQHVRFRHLRGWSVRAIGGSLWITQHGDRRDIILEPGETFRIESNSPVLIGALGKAGVDVRRTHAVCRPSSTIFSATFMQRWRAAWERLPALFA